MDSFLALQRLARSFGERRAARATRDRELRDVAAALGPVALPLCLRELRSLDPRRRQWAETLLRTIGARHRDRVVAALRDLAEGDAATISDELKCAALTLLSDLDEPALRAHFTDPDAIHRRSLGQLAELLSSTADVAMAADLLVTQLDGDPLLELVDALTQAEPARARHLIEELLVRSDLDAAIRGELRRIGAPLALIAPAPLAEPRRGPARLEVLRHPAGRAVVLVSRRSIDGAWRCLAVLIDADGRLGDAIYRDGATPAAVAAQIIDPLVADGFTRAIGRVDAARAEVAAAARRAVEAGEALPSGYFLGRDLLDLGDAHLPPGVEPDVHATLLGRAVDLMAAGEPERARPLLERCVAAAPDDAEAAASYGLCLMSNGDLAGAALHLERAIELEPGWPAHLWNLAAVRHRQDRLAACYLALRRFVGDAERAPALARDQDLPVQLALAHRFLADYERMVHLDRPGVDVPRVARAAERAVAGPAASRPRRRDARVSGRRRRSAPRRSPARP